MIVFFINNFYEHFTTIYQLHDFDHLYLKYKQLKLLFRTFILRLKIISDVLKLVRQKTCILFLFRRHFAFSANNDMAYIYERWLQSKGLYLNLSINYKLIHLFVILKGNY